MMHFAIERICGVVVAPFSDYGVVLNFRLGLMIYIDKR